MGKFFDLHPGPEPRAKVDLTKDLKKKSCERPCLGPRDFKKVELDHAGRARAVLAAAVQGRAPGALAAAVARHTPTETELPSLFAAYGELEEEPAQEWIAGAMGPFGALVPDGAGDGLRGYEDVLVAASTSTAVELRRAAVLDELRDQGRLTLRSREPAREFLRRAGAEGGRGVRNRLGGGKGRDASPQGTARTTSPQFEAWPPPAGPASLTGQACGGRFPRTRSGVPSCTSAAPRWSQPVLGEAQLRG